MRRWLLLALLLLAGCVSKGCPSDAASKCDPSREGGCIEGYYCAAIGVCTKRCLSTDECQNDRTCTATTGLDICAAIECIEGYCQETCAKDDSCNYDPYEP